MLDKFGQAICTYFLANYPNTHPFKLSVDDYIFSEFARMANVDEDRIIQLIQSRGTTCSSNLEALAIAAYQVKIVGDLESVMASGSDSYYQKIRDNYPSYRIADDNAICNGYFSGQINLWHKVRTLFQEHNRNIELPADHPRAGRYVQYPIKSHEMKNTDLLRWADKFRQAGLLPQDMMISYKVFCSRFFQIPRTESYQRTVYNFYKVWDGRSYTDILKRQKRILNNTVTNSVDTRILLDYQQTRVDFFNRSTGEKITKFTELHPLLYTSANKVFFIQNDEDDFYSAMKDKIDFGLDFIVISKTDLNIPEPYLENIIRQKFENVLLYIYVINFSENTKNICTLLDIQTGQKPPMSLVGGLKKSRNCYYTFALPAIEFAEPQTIMYVNSIAVPIKSDRVVLSELKELSCLKISGTIKIVLADYLPIQFNIIDIDSGANKPDEIGWKFNHFRYRPSAIKSTDDTIQGSIIGFNSTMNFIPIGTEIRNKKNARYFIIRNNYLENRFSQGRGF